MDFDAHLGRKKKAPYKIIIKKWNVEEKPTNYI